MYASPFGEGLSIKGTYLCVKNGSDEEKVSGGGGNSLCEERLRSIYLYLRGGGGEKIKSYSLLSKILNSRLYKSHTSKKC